MRLSIFGKTGQENAPDIKVNRTKEGTIFEIISAVLIIIMWGIIISTYAGLPDRIGTHFDLSGHANRTGDKTALIVVGIVGTLTVAVEMIGCYFPKYINFNIKTPTVEHYKMAIRMMRVLGTEIALLFIFVVLQMAGIFPPAGSPLLIIPEIMIAVLLLTCLIFMVLLHRIPQ